MQNLLHPKATMLVALLLASPIVYGQQTTPTKSKSTSRAAHRMAQASATTAPAPPPLPGAPADGPRPPRPGNEPGKHGPNGPNQDAGRVQVLSDFSGTLTEYTAGNEDQLYDGFALKTSAGTETVRFPRHLAQALMAAAKVGSTVTMTGFRDTDPDGHRLLHLVSLTAGNQTVRDQKPVPPTTPPAEQAATVRGTVRSLNQDPRGRTSGVVISDGTVLRLPPDAAEQLAEKLKVGATVAATGTLHSTRPGEVAARPVRVVRAETITLDGVQFLVH
ncbi:OB-fold nucleic acid binding domain-containing protein [Hymenobacter sp. GOD-10R]|uniref:OB-fold nucleic acid binding domain-containing protein n=1 Tax=Hymenobacter sp. GOD-10R TaxID=3093922 RepID=UPI002D791910|nr:OB-fold nucleic acid binding domain-containing protein [Hymenobacter sp. GOD-10R]WRQ26715.1 OB-fold nucleic acid binding domain-containing protein [Hymenobacter sp. GOD-10R]